MVKCVTVLLILGIVLKCCGNNFSVTRGKERQMRAAIGVEHGKFMGNVDLSGVREGREGWSYKKDVIVRLFDEYNKCKTYWNNNQAELKKIVAILAVEGQTLKLKCDICYRPDQKPRISWQRVRTEDSVIELVEPGPDFKITLDWTLVIKSVDIEDAGQYYCVDGLTLHRIYQVDIQFNEPARIHRGEYMPYEATKHDWENLRKSNLKSFIEWTNEWSECDRCDEPGTTRMFGACMVKKRNVDDPVTPVDIPLMALYPDGVPCRSTILRKPMSDYTAIKNRPSEVLIKECNKTCPTTLPPINITDSSGNVIRVVYPSYHSIEEQPKLPPMVVRKVLYEPHRKHLVLKCPTDNQMLVRWQRGEYPIKSDRIRHLTKGRIYIDRLNRFHIRKLRRKDSAVYNCWKLNRHVASLKVLVYKPFDEGTKTYITYGGLGLTILLVTLLCCCHIFKGRKKRG